VKIVLGYPATSQHIQQIRAVCEGNAMDAVAVEGVEQNEISTAIFEADIFFGHAKVPVDWARVVELGKLKWIQSSAAGLDHCLHRSVIESEVVVSGASGVFSTQVAETAMSLLLGLMRRSYVFFPAQQKRIFERQPTDDLRGKRIGIVGFGGNGQQIARCLQPFGVKIWATDYFPDSVWLRVDRQQQVEVEQVLPPADLDQMLRQIDVLIVTVGLTEQTRRMIGAEQIGQMRRGSYLINVGRGEVVDEDALVAALGAGHLTAAGIDVAATEPPPAESLLWQLNNLLITPHIGAQSATRNDDVTDLFCRNLQRYFNGNRLINAVDKKLGFPRPEDRFVCRGPLAE
jgi:D-3-phosphoglycerate dehydrogenase